MSVQKFNKALKMYQKSCKMFDDIQKENVIENIVKVTSSINEKDNIFVKAYSTWKVDRICKDGLIILECWQIPSYRKKKVTISEFKQLFNIRKKRDDE